MIPWLNSDENSPFPPLSLALKDPNGLLAAGGDLSSERLLTAYRSGIFPWFNEDQPILWWSPDPRMVLFPSEFKLSRNLRKRLRQGRFTVTTDTAFSRVIQGCAQTPRHGQNGTWITEEIIAAYTQLHEQGFGHSIETWQPAAETGEPELVGGLYGVAIGRMFYGESMFSQTTDASKAAFAHLVRHLNENAFGLIDCQMKTTHLTSLGAREIPRAEFSQTLAKLTAQPTPPWPSGKFCFTW